MGATLSLCCCKHRKSSRIKSDHKKQALLNGNEHKSIGDEYESDEDQPSVYLKISADDGEDHPDASLQRDSFGESHRETIRQRSRAVHKSYRQWIELIFWQFAGSSTHSKKNLYMTVGELESFLSILHLDDNDEESDELIVTSHKVLTVLEKVEHQKPLITCTEFCEFFCDEAVNPQCRQIEAFINRQSNWLLLQNALKLFDVADVDKSGAIEYGEFVTFCELIGESEQSKVEQLWYQIDKDDSGQIVIHELFEWYSQRLINHQQQILEDPSAGTPRGDPDEE